jgi:hypothetical protein
MKKFIVLAAALFFGFNAFSQTYVKGYVKSNGTYTSGYYRSERNNTNTDNWSTSGNTNPYTGTSGSVAPDYSSRASNYGSGSTIYTGSRGGQYYINSNNNKTYVPKQSNTSTSRRSTSYWSY